MNNSFLQKWKIFDTILEEHSFEIKHTIDDWKHCYYSDNYVGHIEYDIEQDELTIFDEDNNVVAELSEINLDKLNILTEMVKILQ